MKKWIAIPVIAILAVGVIVCGVFLWQQTTKLGDAQTEIVTLEGDVATLEGDVATLEGDVATLEGNVATLEGTVSTLSAELKKVKDPRHFSSLTELTDWLQKDDTNTKYANEDPTRRAFILQVRALRDGYLLPATLYSEYEVSYVINKAVIEGYTYSVWSDSDDVYLDIYTGLLPSHPLPLD